MNRYGNIFFINMFLTDLQFSSLFACKQLKPDFDCMILIM